MNTVEEGVANFRDFQRDARDFFATAKADAAHRTELDKRRAKIHYTLLTLLCGLIIALFTVVLEHYSGNKSTSWFTSTQQNQPQTADTPPVQVPSH